MKVTLIFTFAVVFAILVLWKTQPAALFKITSLAAQPQEDPTSLRARVKKAKAGGATEVEFPAPTPYLADVGSLDEALTSFSVILATPLNATSIQVDEQNIVTYYKFRILETLRDVNVSSGLAPENVPSELEPAGTDEIYLLEGGGTAVIDGTKVTQRGSHQYLKTRKYLLFVSKNSAGTAAIVSLGKYGVFTVKGDDDTIEGIVNGASPLSRDLSERHQNKVTKLRVALKKSK